VATRVVIAGGGVAALEAALALRALAEDRVSVELLAPDTQFWYRPLAVAEPFDLGEVRHFDLAELAAAAGATFSPGALSRLTREDASPRPPRVVQSLTTSCSSPAEPAQARPSPAP
jgi:sulfide:quinone oxidoreductase